MESPFRPFHLKPENRARRSVFPEILAFDLQSVVHAPGRQRSLIGNVQCVGAAVAIEVVAKYDRLGKAAHIVDRESLFEPHRGAAGKQLARFGAVCAVKHGYALNSRIADRLQRGHGIIRHRKRRLAMQGHSLDPQIVAAEAHDLNGAAQIEFSVLIQIQSSVPAIALLQQLQQIDAAVSVEVRQLPVSVRVEGGRSSRPAHETRCRTAGNER